MQSLDQVTQRAADLHWLAYLLTGEREPSLDLAVETLASEESASPYFSNWISAWSRRIVIAKALVAIRDEIQYSARQMVLKRTDRSEMPGREWVLDRGTGKVELERALLAIDVFPRAVVVLSIFERVPIEDTAVLLDVGLDLARKARTIGLQELTRNLAKTQGWTVPAVKKQCGLLRCPAAVTAGAQ